MLELADKDIKAIIIMHSKKIEERLKILYGHMENIKKNIKLLEMKTAMSEMKNTLDR